MFRGLLFLCLAALAGSAFAGCISDEGDEPATVDPDALLARLSQPIFDQVEKLHVQVPGHDGKLQDTWVFKPKSADADDRFPVFINFSPYWGNAAPPAETGGDAFSLYMIEYFVPRGYAVVLASVRGTGDSAGCFPIGGIAELEDAYSVIDHFANVEWSNGNVSSGGKSYDGTTIQGVAGYKPHPALKLIFPVSGISDLYRYNYRGGVPYFHGPIFNTYYYFGQGGDIEVLGASADPRTENPMLVADDVACADLPFVQAHGVATGATGMYNDYWNERNYNRYAENVQAALFYVHGLQDWNVKPDHILPWLDALPADVPKKVWLHQWEVCSGDGDSCTGHVYPMRDDWNLTMLRMMDHFLKGVDTGIMDEPAVQVQDSSGVWRNEDVWPPEHATATSFYFGAGELAAEAPASGVANSVSPGGGTISWDLKLDAPLHYAGIPKLHARLSTTNPEAAWVATLSLVDENGTHWMNEGVLRARLRDSMEMPSPVVPGQFHDYTIEFYPQDDVFPAGSTLRFTLAQSGARHTVNVDVPGRMEIDVGASHLELPLIDTLGIQYEDPQPIETACWAC